MKRKYRPGIPFGDIGKLMEWLMERRPVYLLRDPRRTWKVKTDMKWLSSSFACSMSLMTLHLMVQSRELAPAVQVIPDVVPTQEFEAQWTSDICPKCHMVKNVVMRDEFEGLPRLACRACDGKQGIGWSPEAIP